MADTTQVWFYGKMKAVSDDDTHKDTQNEAKTPVAMVQVCCFMDDLDSAGLLSSAMSVLGCNPVLSDCCSGTASLCMEGNCLL